MREEVEVWLVLGKKITGPWEKMIEKKDPIEEHPEDK